MTHYDTLKYVESLLEKREHDLKVVDSFSYYFFKELLPTFKKYGIMF